MQYRSTMKLFNIKYIMLAFALLFFAEAFAQFTDGDGGTLYFRDRDNDGFGNDNDRRTSTTPLSGYATQPGDWNDTDGTIYPGAYELCDGKDNDGDGSIDEDRPARPTVSVTKNCGNTVITRGNPPSNVTWYWQSSSSGTSTSNSAKSFTRTSNGSYYLRAKHNLNGCWSSVRSGSYTVKSVPSTPTASVSNQCGKSVLTRGNPPSGVTWYWQNSTSGTSTSNTAKTINRTSGSRYYLRARNNSSGCWSGVRTVNYSVKAVPATPSAATVLNQCGQSTLTRGYPVSGYTWYWQSSASGTSTSNSAKTITRTSGSAYYLRSRNNSTGCWSAPRSVSYSIKPAPAVPTAATVSKNCGNTVLTRGNPPSGYTWYWQLNSNWTGTSNSAKTITLTGGSTYYLRARNNSTGCWSAARTVSYSINSIPPTPSAPTVSNQCGKSTLTRSNPPSGITWYWQSSASGTSTANSSTVLTRTSGSTYYLRGRNNTSGCWGPAKPITYGIIPMPTWYKDGDGDGFAESTVNACSSPGSKYTQTVLPVTDCNDDLPAINPDTIWYADSEGDGFGDPNTTKIQCIQPTGYVLDNTDQCPGEYGENQGCFLSDENYVFTRVYQKPVTSPEATGVIENITYFDGLGRPKQQIGIKASPDQKDIVTHIEYDAYGRQAKQYLPFESNTTEGLLKSVNINTDINSYYKNTYTDDFIDVALSDINAYSESVFEASPLNRILKQGAPGAAWKANSTSDNDHTIKFDWKTNTTNEVVYFEVTFTDNNKEQPQLVQGDYYGANQLYVNITKDENWDPGQTNLDDHTTKEYKDKLGRVILKRTYDKNVAHDTYYVYDDFGNLSYILPPGIDVSNGVDTDELNELAFQYRYDYRNRQVAKKIPGKDWEYTIFNKLDQAVLSQDVNLRANNEWIFNKYDALGRTAYTGKITIPNKTREQLQAEVTAFTGNLWVETATTGIYYTHAGYPNTQNAEILTINYYDDYRFDTVGFTAPISIYNVPITTKTKSLATGTKIKVLGTSSWITTVNWYDKKARSIYAATKNEYLQTTNVVETKFDFVGKVLETKTTHTKGNNAAIVTTDTFEYDHMGRMLNQTQSINGQQETLAENTYDALGQLITKKVGNGLQEIDYTYNVLGWLQKINGDSKNDNDAFTFTMGYNQGANPLYNGNISRTEWQTTNDNVIRGYDYTYDALNRIKGAISSDNKYDLSNVTYDKMGNLLTLNRKGHTNVQATTFGDMDILRYQYNAGNKLRKVDDTGAVYGFKDGSNTGDDFEYDLNGNMTKDRNKGITAITYNHLNLPETITLSNSKGTGTISYVYNATGAKLKKIFTEGSTTTNTEYASGYIYKNNQLQYISTPEGYATPNGNAYRYVYQYKDHLGNTRLSYTQNDSGNLEIIQESNYYPYGLTQRGYNSAVSPLGNSTAQLLKFGGKEEQDELGLIWYDVTARNYDPAIARWMNLDPLAEVMRRHSPYNYAFDNPIYFIDPDGRLPFGNGGTNGGGVLTQTAGQRLGNAVVRKAKSLWNAVTSLASNSTATNVALAMTSLSNNQNLQNGANAALSGDVAGVAKAVGESVNSSIDQIAATENVSTQDATVMYMDGVVLDVAASIATDGLVAGVGKGASAVSKIDNAAPSISTKIISEAKRVHPDVNTSTLTPGPNAKSSIPARSKSQSFTKAERNAINEIGSTDGCHTCGSTSSGRASGNFTPDHQPPSALIPPAVSQDLYPHCASCSSSQGGTVGALKRKGFDPNNINQ